ncbi:MAG: hypothetical protein J0I20_26830 [Chloroflexi bacterium]|nr:hypothetical protein [Chloroflexota bacterium]
MENAKNQIGSDIHDVQILATFEIKNHQVQNLKLAGNKWQNYLRGIENSANKTSYDHPDGQYYICTHNVFPDGKPWDYFWKRVEK